MWFFFKFCLDGSVTGDYAIDREIETTFRILDIKKESKEITNQSSQWASFNGMVFVRYQAPESVIPIESEEELILARKA